MGLSLNMKWNSVLVLNAYMPCNCHDQADEFSIYLGKISSIISDCVEHICLIGEFNSAQNSPRFSEVIAMCNDHNLSVAYIDI